MVHGNYLLLMFLQGFWGLGDHWCYRPQVWVTHPGLLSCPFYILNRQGFLQSFIDRLISTLGIQGGRHFAREVLGLGHNGSIPDHTQLLRSKIRIKSQPGLSKAVKNLWNHGSVCLLYSSQQSMAAECLSLERDWQERGWEHSRGCNGIINHPFTAL